MQDRVFRRRGKKWSFAVDVGIDPATGRRRPVRLSEASSPGHRPNQAARSIDLLDPWGNQVEILQIG